MSVSNLHPVFASILGAHVRPVSRPAEAPRPAPHTDLRRPAPHTEVVNAVRASVTPESAQALNDLSQWLAFAWDFNDHDTRQRACAALQRLDDAVLDRLLVEMRRFGYAGRMADFATDEMNARLDAMCEREAAMDGERWDGLS